ncbi:MAG TPA: lysylphosphatidylglycerol synthase transmembrane domain-containing protein [Chloroflexota bacterium]|nr:lysylphosphatidylglycerol synthase transmembrane domain-containing protein [Chloroflexota bacterium]
MIGVPAEAGAATEGREGVSLKQRLRDPKTILSFVVGVLLLVTVFRKLGDFEAAARTIRGINVPLYLLAFVAYAMTFPMRGLRWQRLLRNVGERHPVGEVTEYVFLSWFVNCLVPAKIGDVYRGYLAKKNNAISLSKSMGTIFAERIIDTLIIFFTFGITGLIVFRNHLPGEVRLILEIGIALAALMAGALLFMRHFGEAVFTRFASPRVVQVYKRFEEGTLGSFQSLEVVLFFTFAAWVFEALRLFTVAHALAGGTPALDNFNVVTAVFAMVTSSILTLVPTPGGLGAVEGGLTGILIFVGLQPGIALAIVIMDRIVSYWSLVLSGAITYFVSKRAR